MDDVVIETTSMPWRVIVAVVSIVIVAGVLVNVLTMLRGEWTWDGKGIAIAVALALLALVALAGNGLVWTTRVSIDARAQTFALSSFGKTQVRSLAAPTTVRFQISNVGALRQWKITVKQPDELPLSVSTPIMGNPRVLAEELARLLESNPGLPADEFTRAKLSDPGSIRTGIE